MRIKKIKTVDNKVEIEFQVKSKKGQWKNLTLTNPDEPPEEFTDALEKLKPELIKLCEVEKLDTDLIRVTGAALSYKGGNNTLNAVITGIKTYENSGGCLPLNSPIKAAAEATGEPTAAENLLSEECVKNITTLIEYATDYLDEELDFSTEPEPKPAPEPEEESDELPTEG